MVYWHPIIMSIYKLKGNKHERNLEYTDLVA
jgi:hypothetical protein